MTILNQNGNDMKSEKRRILSLPLSTKDIITELANSYGVSYSETENDRFANEATRLSGDNITLDGTDLLIIALRRAGILSKSEVVPLLGRYMLEQRSPPTLQDKKDVIP
jgi:hypothetical protein